MAETARPESSVLGEPGDRGTLTIRDRVAQKLVLEATRGTPGVRHHAGGMDKLTGRELPRARVLVSGKRVRAKVDIAIEWPGSLSVIGTAVRENVTTQLQSVSGLDVDGVDVAIVSVLPASTTRDAGRTVR
ncbi:Asp23/Gls24 family envelope stress response protein [Rhodococcus sp. SG20037]|uniref:Asp23/Gls24 family envelope stress response protein n=1 Tax=Rhodococcus sp. SG20037 TaxID=3074148 RepID=UPI00287F6B55|nr:Asp23/Gls24 family envelope stress response protein [Rhodococcus sp. SG20037]WNF43058.1 Asp23/Gls24 family envelope stress response protein [Rhodococcus sp. SG20037]